MERAPLVLCVCFIALASIANLVRFLWDIPVMIGSLLLPGWTGAILFILLGLLAAWGFRALCPCRVKDPENKPK